MYNNVIIKFHDIKNTEPPKILKNYLEALLNYAPFKSTCYLHVFKENKNYLCKLTVHSNLKTFSSDYKGEDLKKTIKIVLKNVKKQMSVWKNNRSSEELTGIISVAQLNLNELNYLDNQSTDLEDDYKKSA